MVTLSIASFFISVLALAGSINRTGRLKKEIEAMKRDLVSKDDITVFGKDLKNAIYRAMKSGT